MAAGFDAAGIILSVFPIVIGAVEWYGARIKSSDIRLLALSLKNNERIFLDSLEHLLQPIVSPDELHHLLRDLGGDAWRSASLHERIAEHLGVQADAILESINQICKTMQKLKKKLPVHSNDADPNMLDRAKHVIKFFVHGKLWAASLERLNKHITEFRKLCKGALRLATSRQVLPRALRELTTVHECARGLYDAVQAGWQCECDEAHPASIKLDTWSARVDDGGAHQFQFCLLFADDAQTAQPDHWMVAEVTPPAAAPELARSVTLQSTSTTLTPTPSIGLSAPSSAPTVTSPSQEDVAGLIDDLCTLLRNLEHRPRPARRRLGSISDPTNGHNFHLSKEDHSAATLKRKSVTVTELFGQQQSLTNRNRVQLGLALAWAVLQISSTNWLSGRWTKDNILLVIDGPGKPVPYVSHRFESARRMSRTSTLTPQAESHIAEWVRSSSLFALGVFLIEICYGQSIENLAIDMEKEGGEMRPLTSFLTAVRLSQKIHEELGGHYSQAVNACLNPQGFDIDLAGNPTDLSQFAKSVMGNIIDPLKAAAEWYGKQNSPL